MGYVTRVPGTAILAASHNSEYRDQVISVFASTAARDAAITVPVRGMMCFVTATGRMYVRSATAWREVGIADSQSTVRQYRASTAAATGTAVPNTANTTALSWATEVVDTDGMAAVPFTALTLTEGVWAVSVTVQHRVVTAAASTFQWPAASGVLPAVVELNVGGTVMQRQKLFTNNGGTPNITASLIVDNFAHVGLVVPVAAATTLTVQTTQTAPTVTGTATVTLGGQLQATQVG